MARIARRAYHENIVEHYENPRNVGSLDKKDKFVGTVSCWMASRFPSYLNKYTYVSVRNNCNTI